MYGADYNIQATDEDCREASKRTVVLDSKKAGTNDQDIEFTESVSPYIAAGVSLEQVEKEQENTEGAQTATGYK